MQHVERRITFLRTVKIVCVLSLAPTFLVVLTPQNTSALSLGEVVGQLTQVADTVVASLGSGDVLLAKKQSQGANNKSSQSPAAQQPATAEPSTPIPQDPPTSEALPPPIELIEDVPPSRQQLLGLIAEPLIAPDFLKRPAFAGYPDVDSFGVLRPSTEGWKFLGISWIWWVSGFGALWLGNRLRMLYASTDA